MFEVIVRDNSESSAKNDALRRIDSQTLRIFTAPNLGAYENCVEALRQASGEFVFLLADDDWVFAPGLRSLHSLAVQAEADLSVSCVTGPYLLEASTVTGLLKYSDIDNSDGVVRLSGYFKANGPNALYYSAVRRSLANFSFQFLDSLPYKFSYHDQLLSLIYLAAGRVIQVDRVVYCYDFSEWDVDERSLMKDRASYVSAGLPAEFSRLHWLFAALEGALLLNSQLLRAQCPSDPTRLTDSWFGTLFGRFKFHERESPFDESAANIATKTFKAKWIAQTNVSLNELLLDLCDLLEVADKEGAKRYFEFWSAL